jgi:hypothetical protein
MVKKFASYVAVAATVIGNSAPCFADDMAGKALAFPFKVTGSAISTAWGVPLGLTKGGVEGSMKTTKMVADKMGDKECPVKTAVAAVVGGPFGAVGGGARSVLLKVPYTVQKPVMKSHSAWNLFALKKTKRGTC